MHTDLFLTCPFLQSSLTQTNRCTSTPILDHLVITNMTRVLNLGTSRFLLLIFALYFFTFHILPIIPLLLQCVSEREKAKPRQVIHSGMMPCILIYRSKMAAVL